MKAGIIGCGAVTEELHLPAIVEQVARGRLSIAAVYDTDRRRSEMVASRLEGARVVGSLEELTAQGLDWALVASPPACHQEQVLSLLDAGVSVLCEKPLCTTTGGAQAMVAAASRAGKVLSVAHVRRFAPACREIKRWLADGILGEVVSFTASEGGRFTWPLRSDSLFNATATPGGVLFDLGVHLFDTAVYWFGDVEVTGYEDDAMGGVEANCLGTLALSGSLPGRFRLSRDWHLPARYRIRCQGGTLTFDPGRPNEFAFQLTDSPYAGRCFMGSESDGLWRGAYPQTLGDCFAAQLAAFMDAVSGAASPVVAGSEAIAPLRMIERCYAGRALMPIPWLTPEEASEAARRNLSMRRA
jgi:predicted dehydrogenase